MEKEENVWPLMSNGQWRWAAKGLRVPKRLLVIEGMQPENFFALNEAQARARGAALFALWFDARGDWDRAHELAQTAGDSDDAKTAKAGCWVHAYLHRVEGDETNAGYWYARAGRRAPERGADFAEERRAITAVLLAA